MHSGNLDAKLRVVPGERIKMGVEHDVPLTDAAVDRPPRATPPAGTQPAESFKRAADMRGMAVSSWLRDVMRKQARADLAEIGEKPSFNSGSPK
jgi:hypothetical protein